VSCVLPDGHPQYLQAVARHTKNITVFPYQWWSKSRPFDKTAVSHFENAIRRWRPELVHVNTIMVSDPLIAARRLQVPSIVHARELIDNDPDLLEHFGCNAQAVVKSICAAADFIIANSDATHRLYHKPDRSFRLYNSVDAALFDLTNDAQVPKLRVGIISSNTPKKGILHFLKLAALAKSRCPHLQFLVIGPRTDHVSALERLAQAEALTNLRFTGYAADPVEAIRRVDVVVSFSIFAESFGRTVAEAMAASRPVIAYAWGAAPELVRNKIDGLIIPYLDYAEALDGLEALSDNPQLLSDMGRNGRDRARRLFSPEVFAANLNDIYRQMLATWRKQEG
jgi:glycosyltransferase involved in cell wall biosynthesis